MFIAEQSKIHKNESNVNFDIYNHDDLIQKFRDRIENVVNKEIYIENQIRNIEQKVFKQESQRENNNTDSRPRYFLEGYQGQYFNNNEPDLESRLLDYLHLYSLNNGNELAKFQKHLVKELNKLKSKDKKQDSGKKFTIKQQFIALHYLGALDKIQDKENEDENDNTASKQAAFLHLLTGSSFQNLRGALSSINKILDFKSSKRSLFERKDLEVVYKAFTDLGSKNLLKQIEEDLKGQEK